MSLHSSPWKLAFTREHATITLTCLLQSEAQLPINYTPNYNSLDLKEHLTEQLTSGQIVYIIAEFNMIFKIISSIITPIMCCTHKGRYIPFEMNQFGIWWKVKGRGQDQTSQPEIAHCMPFYSGCTFYYWDYPNLPGLFIHKRTRGLCGLQRDNGYVAHGKHASHEYYHSHSWVVSRERAMVQD